MVLQGKKCFVTGGANGIGKGICRHLINEGASVAFCDIDSEKGLSLQNETGAFFIKADVSDETQLTSALELAVEKISGLDVIVNNAGISEFVKLEEITLDQFDRVIYTNLRPAFITSRFFKRLRMSDSQTPNYGRIINISSTRYLQSEPGSEAYAASKGGIVSLTHALAASFTSSGVTVNCISPGWIENGDYDALSEEDHNQHFSGRVGMPADIARMVVFLCDPQNDFINGQNLVIDGGMTKKMIYV